MLAEIWSDLRYRARALFQRDAMEHDLDVELRFHIEREVEALVQQGLTPTEAARQARRVFGGLEQVKEASRDGRGIALLESLGQDLRYAWRGLRARPGFATGIILTLALGLGVNAAVFGVADRVLLRPPPYLRTPDRVHRVYVSYTADRARIEDGDVSVAAYLDFVRWTHAFSTVA